MSKQDGYSSRTAADLERKYNFGKTFAEVYGLLSDAQRAVEEAKKAVDSLTPEEIFNRLTNYGEYQGIYRGDDGNVYINAEYIKGGKIKAGQIEIDAANITGTLLATNIDTKDLQVLAANVIGTLTAGQIDTTNLQVSAANITGKLTAYQIDTTYLKVDAANITGALTAEQIGAVSLSVNAADIKGQLTVGQLPNGVAMTSDIPTDYVTERGVTSIVNGIVTTDYLYALGVSANYIRGEDVVLANDSNKTVGTLSMTGASTSTYAIELYSKGALRLEAGSGAAYIGAGDAYVHVEEGEATINNGSVGINMDTQVWVSSGLYPNRANSYQCGNANYPWSAVYSTNGMCETSDRKKKKDIEYGLDNMDGFFDGLMPSSYRMVDGTSGRKHCGFVAQDIKSNLDKHGISTKDFGGYVADTDGDGNEILSLRYSEFIPLIVDQVQKLKARVAELEGNKRGQKA